VLRCVNQRGSSVEGSWRMARVVTEARRARLDETLLDVVPVQEGVIRFTAAPKEIVTILVR
jgi:hypothetical protein